MTELVRARLYYESRIEELGDDWDILTFENLSIGGRLNWGVRCVMEDSNGAYQSVYVLEQYRNHGLMKTYVKSIKGLEMPFITVPDCNIQRWFENNQVPHLVVYPQQKRNDPNDK